MRSEAVGFCDPREEAVEREARGRGRSVSFDPTSSLGCRAHKLTVC